MYLDFDKKRKAICKSNVFTISCIKNLKSIKWSKELGYENLVLLILLWIDPASAYINLSDEHKLEQIVHQEEFVKDKVKVEEIVKSEKFKETLLELEPYLYSSEYRLMISYQKKVDEISTLLNKTDLHIDNIDTLLKAMEKAPKLISALIALKTVVKDQAQEFEKFGSGGKLTFSERQAMKEQEEENG